MRRHKHDSQNKRRQCWAHLCQVNAARHVGEFPKARSLRIRRICRRLTHWLLPARPSVFDPSVLSLAPCPHLHQTTAFITRQTCLQPSSLPIQGVSFCARRRRRLLRPPRRSAATAGRYLTTRRRWVSPPAGPAAADGSPWPWAPARNSGALFRWKSYGSSFQTQARGPDASDASSISCRDSRCGRAAET